MIFSILVVLMLFVNMYIYLISNLISSTFFGLIFFSKVLVKMKNFSFEKLRPLQQKCCTYHKKNHVETRFIICGIYRPNWGGLYTYQNKLLLNFQKVGILHKYNKWKITTARHILMVISMIVIVVLNWYKDSLLPSELICKKIIKH